MGSRIQAMYHSVVLVVALISMIDDQGRVSCTKISARNHLASQKSDHSHLDHDLTDSNPGHQIEGRDSNRLSTTLQPFYVSNSNTVYGGFSSKPLRLETKSSGRISIGSLEFYKQDLYGYIRNGLTPSSGIFGYAAHFDLSSSSSDYSFFKSVPNGQSTTDIKNFSSRQSRSMDSKTLPEGQADSDLSKRQDDRVQCRNQNGQSILFSRNDCSSAAAKMTSEKTAISTSGGCKLIMIGPQGQLSSSNMPAGDLQTHASSILDGCVTGQRSQFTNLAVSSIPRNLKPTFVLLVTQAS